MGMCSGAFLKVGEAMNSELYMRQAINEAKKAIKYDEVPIGCVIVKDGEIIARGYNKKEKRQDVTGHAEIVAIKKAAKALGTWRLNDCDLYVTLEPCIMCCGAIVQSRIHKVYYGAIDSKAGGVVSLIEGFNIQGLNHAVLSEGSILEDECSNLLKDYFQAKRNHKK